MKSDHAVVNLKFYKIASINCEKFDFTKDTSEGFYESGEESDYYRVMSSSELGLMKSDHSVVFNEFRYQGGRCQKTSEKFDFIKSHATRFMTPAESDLKNLIKTSEEIDFIKDTSEGFYESGEV
jgi:hypothetical protein